MPVQEHNEQFSTKGVKGQTNKPKQVGSFRQLRIGGCMQSQFHWNCSFKCLWRGGVCCAEKVLSVAWEVGRCAPRC